MVSGQAAYDILEAQQGLLDRRRRSAVSQLHGIEGEIRTLTRRIRNSYETIARTHLTNLTLQAISDLDFYQKPVQEFYDQKQAERKQIEEEIEQSEEQQKVTARELRQATVRVNALEGQRDSLLATYDARLEQNPEYAALEEQEQELKELVDQGRAIIDEETARDAAYLETYQDPFFQYLVRRKFGTDQHEGNAFTRKWDQQVAEHIDFEDFKPIYDELTAKPALMEVYLADIIAEFERVGTAADAIEARTAEAVGIPSLDEKIQAAEVARDEVLSRLESEERYHDTLETREAHLENTKGTYHQRAISELRGFLEGKSLRQLYEIAQSSDSYDDDLAVKNIDQFKREIDDQRDQARDQQLTVRYHEDQRRGFTEVMTKFRQFGFDGRRSYFDADFDLQDAVELYVEDRITADDLWNRMRIAHKVRPKPRPRPRRRRRTRSRSSSSDSWGSVLGSVLDSASSSSRSSGGFGGGGFFSGGGGFGGGGFSSGGRGF